MSDGSHIDVHTVHTDTQSGDFTVANSYTLSRRHLIRSVKVIGHNPADADGDTLALDISYSTDGFSSSDVEVAAVAAAEYNDTDNAFNGGLTAEVPSSVTLTAANTSTWGDDTVTEVPANANVKTTITWTGAPADGSASVVIERVML